MVDCRPEEGIVIRVMDDLPESVLGVEAIGKVTADDYQRVLVPTIEAKLAESDRVRFLYVLGDDFEGYEAEAMWDDAKVGMDHLGKWERVAVVTDHAIYGGFVKVFGFVMPGRVRVFAGDQLDEAKAWIAA